MPYTDWRDRTAKKTTVLSSGFKNADQFVGTVNYLYKYEKHISYVREPFFYNRVVYIVIV